MVVMLIGAGVALGLFCMVVGWALCSAAARADAAELRWEQERHLSESWQRTHGIGGPR